MTNEDARLTGIDNGYDAALNVEVSEDDRFDASCECESECEECLRYTAFEAETNARQYSPFEFFAHDINESDDADEIWESYDEGVSEGIEKGIKERLSESILEAT